MQNRRFLLTGLVILLLGMMGMPSLAQDNEPITMVVDTGFNSFFRPGYWLPLQIQVRNDGQGFSGRLTVRPETSGRAVNSAFSTPIDLPNGSDKTVFLYVQAQGSARSLTIELIDDEGVRFAETVTEVNPINSNDALHVVVSGTGASSIALNGVSQPAFSSRQVRWQVDNVPPDWSALAAVDTLVLYDVESDLFSVDQLSAIEAWVTSGGQLIAIGGPNWVTTNAGFEDGFLPFIADGSQNIDNISTLADFTGQDATLATRTFITTGTVTENASVLVATDEGLPLLVRRNYGLGTIDYLTVDPTLEPLRSWDGLDDFWFRVVATVQPEPGWQRGLLDLQEAVRSAAILPNIDLLPPATSMILFIGAYIFLIGPVNYLILSRMRRRAWAWVTIPLFIVTFTLLAWNVGFNLRGNDVIVSRLYVVQSFPDTDIALQTELVGVLSPRREFYDITAPDETVMGILPGVEDDSPFSANVSRSTADVLQGNVHTVNNVAIDGGIFANFSFEGTVPAPNISGSATFSYITDSTPEDAEFNTPTPQDIRGFVRNDSDITLDSVVIVTRNRFYRVAGDFEPGDVLDFDSSDFEVIVIDDTTLIPNASPLQSAAVNDISETVTNRRDQNESLVTARVLLDINWATDTNPRDDVFDFDFEDEGLSRRRALLRSFLRDQFGSGGIGNEVYVFGWSNEQQSEDITIADAPYRSVDTTFHIIELDTTIDLPTSGDTVTLSADQFTWVATDQEVGQVSGDFNELTIISPGWAEFDVMPIEGAVLSEVDSIIVEVNRGTSLGRQVEILLWNHDTAEWDALENTRLEEYLIENPASYLGYNNTVSIRFAIDAELITSNSNGRILQLRVIQSGNF